MAGLQHHRFSLGRIQQQHAAEPERLLRSSGLAISKVNPAANQTPNATNGWNNYQFVPNTPTDRWEATGKVTYAFNDNNKLWGSYTYQTETDSHPLSIWWAPEWTIPYPGKPVGKETAKVYLINYTHVFNASTTNEFVFSEATVRQQQQPSESVGRASFHGWLPLSESLLWEDAG